eukprot:6398063-Alexandrium_andersonii.AAC.1
MIQSDALGAGNWSAFWHCSAASASKTAPACLQMGQRFTWSTHSKLCTTSAAAAPGEARKSTST